ncbi:MAG: Ig-like domain-containing protein [Eubacterium sp.]|nr:Ig-like domain-containing protein [Eubacterium sp.]
MKKPAKVILSLVLSGALIVSATGIPAEAKTSSKVSLSKTKLTLKIGQKTTLKVKKKKVKKIKSIKWSSSKKSVVSISKKGVLKAKKTGKATIKAKVKYIPKGKKKAVTKTLKCQVTVKKKTTNSTQATKAPTTTATATPAVTPTAKPTTTPEATPAVYGNPGEIATYDTNKSNYTLNVDALNQVHEISDMLYGIFIEDINFVADGGLYAEMVQNRSFEFTSLASGNEKHAWSNVGTVTTDVVKNDTSGCLNANNPNYMVITNTSSSNAGIANKGFLDGMSITKDNTYKFSIYAKGMDGYTGPVEVSIMNGSTVAAKGTIDRVTDNWKKYQLELTSSVTSHSGVTLRVTIPKGKLAVDMVSLFPSNTYKGRENGLRKDLAEKLEALHPKFLRFPGGCVIEGATLQTAYSWKDSIGADADGEPYEFNGTYGDVAARKQGQNIWTDELATNDENPSYMSYGLGFYEYFQLAEDLGATGVPVVNAGMCCMGQAYGTSQATAPAIGSAEFQRYIQDALDLVEFCRGDETTKWGKIRIAMGHKEPFKLKYVGIGNEQWGDKFYKRYEAFVDAFAKAKEENPEMYGDIELMFTAGVDDGDSDKVNYAAAYKEADAWLQAHPGKTIDDFAGAVDHHYYNDPEWFLNHTDYYDEKNYSRDAASMTQTQFGGGMNVFLGEYAARSNQWRSALAEAAYMTGLERNGDIVKMAAYAPLFGNLTALHWAPDLIWFNNNTSTCSVNYYVQQVFAKNAGTTLLKSELNGAKIENKDFQGKVGVGTWNTAATFANAKVVSNENGTVLAQDNFAGTTISDQWQKISDGNWSVSGGKLVQSSTTTNTALYGNTGSTMYFGDASWENYTFTVEATKTSGSEGFLIPFSVADTKENYFWNIGGWDNTVSCLQRVTGGVKSDQIGGTTKNVRIVPGTTYQLKVVVSGRNVKCYIDNALYVDYTIEDNTNAESYQVVSTDATGDVIIKMVNVTGYPKTFALNIEGIQDVQDVADLDVVAGNSTYDDNILGQQEVVQLKSSKVNGVSGRFNYTVPKYSVNVLRIKKK